MILSIIIPVFNEEATIIDLLNHLHETISRTDQTEIIIVDGKSTDATLEKVRTYTTTSQLNLRLENSNKGRAVQLHHGASVAKGEIYYFLHADSYPPKNFDQYITDDTKKGHLAGCFKMKFRSKHPWLLLMGWFTQFSWKISRGGDQSQYITKKLYHQIGGYNTQYPFYEDYDLIARLYKKGHYHVIQKWLTTSARRYHEKGVFKLQWFYLVIYWKKYRGASMREIHTYYLRKCW
jgi:rSAM/selenodomain-associated transferase 2